MLPYPIIFFDGYCNLCSWWVNFIIQHDKQGQFRFCALQSAAAEKLLNKFNLPEKNKTVVLLADDKVYLKSTAALTILKKLKGVWSLLYVFIIIPPFIRDAVYKFIAAHRYSWFGLQQSCYLPQLKDQDRFIN